MFMRAAAISFVFGCAAGVLAQEPIRVQPGSGVIATRANAAESWSIRHAGDALPLSFDFRVGPTRPVRVEISGGILVLAGETAGHWDGEQRQLNLSQGQALLRTDENAKPLQVKSSHHSQLGRVLRNRDRLATEH